jgi:hypothetical protein
MTRQDNSLSTRPLLRALSVLALAACGQTVTGSTAEFPFAQATNSCAPTDAPAVSIMLSAKPFSGVQLDPPSLTLNIWTRLSDLSGKSFRVAQGSNDGFGWFSAENDPRDGAVSGTVTVSTIAPDSSIIGAVNVTLIDGSRVAREFVAPWRPTPTRCG